MKKRKPKKLVIEHKGMTDTKEYWSSGNLILDKKMEQIVYDVKYQSSNQYLQDKRKVEIRLLLNSFPDFKEQSLTKLKSLLNVFLRETPKPQGGSMTAKVLGLRRKGTENVLQWLNDLNDKPVKTKRKDYTKTNWFFIGLKFADGKMDKLLKKHSENCTQIAIELGNEKGYRPYISETLPYISESAKKKNQTDKNIYASSDKMQKIQAYCLENNIKPTSHFIAALMRVQSS